MEGKKIISEFQSLNSWDGFDARARVKGFLDNVLSSSKLSKTTPPQCELFCLKLLRLCAERLRSKSDVKVSPDIGLLCVHNLNETSGSSGKSPKLAFEKILLHFARACLANKLFGECEESMGVLYTQLTKTQETASGDVMDLLQHSYDTLCEACVKAKEYISLEKILDLKKQALKCLLASKESNLCTVFEKAQIGDQLYRKAIRQKLKLNSDSDLTSEHYKVLFDFHRGVLKIEHYLKKNLSCHVLVPVCQYSLAVVKVCVLGQRVEEGTKLLSRTRDLVRTHRCKECVHGDMEALKCQLEAMQVWKAMENGDWLSDKSRSSLQQLSMGLGKQSSLSTTPSVLLKLVETLELVIVGAVQTHKEALLMEAASRDSHVFQRVRTIITTAVTLLDVFLKNPPKGHPATLEQKGRKRQLDLLRFHGSILVNVLTSTMELEGSRSSSCSHVMLSPAHNDIASSFYPVLKQSQDILKKAGTSLCVTEHRWLGADALNIGNALLDHDQQSEACQVFSLGLEELLVWVMDGEGADTQLSRAKEVQLFEAVVILADVQRSALNAETALTTLSTTLTSLPVSILSTPDCVDTITAVWAKTKEFVRSQMREASSPPVGVTLPELLGRTIVEGAKRLPDSVKILYLEGELKAGKTCGLSCVALLPAVDALLALHTSHTERARLTIEKAILSRGRGRATILLEEAMGILKHVGEARAYEQLAIAHLWKAICVGEQIIGLPSSSDASSTATPNDGTKRRDEVEQERETALSHEEEKLMMSDDIPQSLHSSVDHWEKLLSANQLSVSDLSSQYLSLTAQFSLAHSQPLLALRTLKVLLELSPPTHTSTPARVTRLNALALYSNLLLSFKAPLEQQLTELETAAEEKVGCGLSRRETLELSVVLANCRLSLARVHLSRGQVESSRSLLLSVLTDSCLKETGSLPFDLVARAKLLAADLIQQEGFVVKSTSELLSSMSSGADERGLFKLTPIELVIDASRLMIKLADHKKVLEEADTVDQPEDLNKAFTDADTLEEATPTFSSNVGAWHILVGLLESLRRVTTLYLCQGHLRKAHTKAREGAMMAKQVLLQGWYMEFLLLLTEIHTMLGSYHLSSLHSTQVATLLEFPLPASIEGNNDGDDETVEGKKDESGGAKKREKEPQCADVSLTSIDSDSLHLSDSLDSSGSSDSSFNSTFSSTLLHGRERFSPSTHPSKCDCSLCSSLIANGHLGRLLALYCSNTLDQTLHTMGQSSSQQEQDKVRIVSTQLMSILHKGKELLKQRKQQCETMLSSHLQQPKKELKKKSKSTKKYSASIIPTHPAFIVGLTELSLTIGECHLALLQPTQAIDHISSTLTELGLPQNLKEICGCTHHHHKLSLCLAKAQYTLGVARLQQIEQTQPELAKRIWSNPTTVVDKENEGAASEVKKSTRSARKTRTTKALSEINTTKESRLKPDCLKPKNDTQFPSEPLDHLILSYQLGVVLGSSVLVRDCCRWLCVLLSMEVSTADLCPLFLAESMAVSLSHHTSLTLGVKIRSQVSSKSPFQHASETVSTLTPHTPSQAIPSSLEKARHALHTPSHSSLPHDWVMCTIAPAPVTHYTHPQHILISRISEEPKSKKAARSKLKPPGESSTSMFLKMSLPTGGLDSFLREFDDLQKRMNESMHPCEIRKWWAARRQLDTEMERLFVKFERTYVGSWFPPLCLSAGGAVILVLGERVVGLPWESLSLLADKVVCRMPSLKFTTAHMHMTEHTGEVTVNQDSAFYVLNPGGDLLKTQSVFATWFNTQEGWEGVVGRPPTDTEYTSALQSKDLYVYCGHSFGNFLTSSGFQQLSCRSTALLLGCSSAHLQEGGRSDPMGPTLNFLMSGSPSVVGCLWNVSDGDIDRFSRALFKSTKKSNSHLSTMVAESKQACKLPWVTGAAAVVYGVPVTFRD